MAKRRSMTRNHNHDDDGASSSSSSSSSCSRKRFKTFDNADVACWSDLHDDVLYLVMMRLGVVDFVAFSGVCKSWRSYALPNKNTFMASKLPMSLCIKPRANNQDPYCCLKDSEGRRFKTILPHSYDMMCFGLTCGHVILFGRKTRDFWLVNPITRHELHFPDYPLYVGAHAYEIKGILVFSHSISRFVFVVLHRNTNTSFYIEGKRRWNHVSSTVPILDLNFFKGNIYTLHTDCSLCELRLYPNRKHKWMLLETNNLPHPDFLYPELVSSGENLYVIDLTVKKVMELALGEMKWVSLEKTVGECVFFISVTYSAAMKLESWADPRTPNKRHGYFHNDDGSQQWIYYYERMWYFPHDCLNVSVLND